MTGVFNSGITILMESGWEPDVSSDVKAKAPKNLIYTIPLWELLKSTRMLSLGHLDSYLLMIVSLSPATFQFQFYPIFSPYWRELQTPITVLSTENSLWVIV